MKKRLSIILFLAGILSACVSGHNPVQPADIPSEEPAKVKTVSILGDSYSTFEGWIPEGYIAWYKPVPKPGRPTDVTDVDQTWWKIYLDSTGYQLETNNSYSGSTISNTGYDGKDYSDRSFINRVGLLGDPDIIFVFGGTNDDWANSPLGEYKWEEWEPNDLYSYRPAAAYMMNNLLTLYPQANILVIVNDDISEQVKSSTAEICRHYGIDFLQLEGIEKQSGHPDKAGMQKIADMLPRFD